MSKSILRWRGGMRFQKRVRLGRWLVLNLARESFSVTVGIQGLQLNIGKRGLAITLGVPGTGWSYRGGVGWHHLKRLGTGKNQDEIGEEPWTSKMN